MRTPMPRLHALLCLVITLSLSGSLFPAERGVEEIAQIYREAATLAAGDDHQALFNTVCPVIPRVPAQPPSQVAARATSTRTIPPIDS